VMVFDSLCLVCVIVSVSSYYLSKVLTNLYLDLVAPVVFAVRDTPHP
jgi:hypothetical protein